jgi:hypothetical protein
MKTTQMDAGGYSFIPGVLQYSAGVGALPGFQIERVRFSDVVPLHQGFERIAAWLTEQGRPLTALCACELRSPEPFSEQGFADFNRAYAGVLRDWNIMDSDVNPVARTNVCPEIGAPGEPGFHAFCYTVPALDAQQSFVIAGSGEVPEGKDNYRDHIIRRGETGTEALREKARWVLGEMERRMAFFDAGWRDTTSVQLYTVYDIHPFLGDELVSRDASRHGLTWHYTRPPVIDLDYEMDCRRLLIERVMQI